MFRIPGLDDEESYNLYNQYFREGVLGEAPNPDSFQAQQPQAPELAQGLLDTVTQQMPGVGSDNAQNMATVGQQIASSAMAAGANRMAQQQAANQAAMQQDQQGKGGLLSGLLKLGAGVALNNWIGGMFPKKGG